MWTLVTGLQMKGVLADPWPSSPAAAGCFWFIYCYGRSCTPHRCCHGNSHSPHPLIPPPPCRHLWPWPCLSHQLFLLVSLGKPCLLYRYALSLALPGLPFWLALLPGLDLAYNFLYLTLYALSYDVPDLTCTSLVLILTFLSLDLDFDFIGPWCWPCPPCPWFLP